MQCQEHSAALENVTRTIGNLLKGYDIRLRPNFGGEVERKMGYIINADLADGTTNALFFPGDPLYVGFDLTIASFDSISEVSMVRKHEEK